MKYINSIITDESINMVFDDCVKTVTNTFGGFAKVKDLILKNKWQEALDMIDIGKYLTRHSSGMFWVKDGVVYTDQKNPVPVPNALSKRILAFADAGLEVKPLLRFWENLQKNPSVESKKDLYAFLEHNNIPITKDGCFIAYKRVRKDFMDIHSGKFSNTVGSIVKMDRSKVNPDRNITCSTGLHVAAFRYADKFYSDGYLLEVKVNPVNVVAVPIDYSNEKMRVCEYEVIKVGGSPREELLYTDDSSYKNTDTEDDYYDDDILSEEDTPVATAVKAPVKCDAPKKKDATIATYILSVCADGRISVTSEATRKAGFSPTDYVYAYCNNSGEIVLEQDVTAKNVECRAYAPDAKDGSVKIGAKLASKITKNRYDSVAAKVSDGKIVIC